jgi:hypothetical protein
MWKAIVGGSRCEEGSGQKHETIPEKCEKGLGALLKWQNTCLATQRPEFIHHKREDCFIKSESHVLMGSLN